MAAAAPDNVRVESLKFKDDSQYRGQVRASKAGSVPHGYGRMVTKEGFQMIGAFSAGKACGPGIFRAPNGDAFYGYWNKANKRDGTGIGVNGKDRAQTVETYADGKMQSKVKRAAVPAGVVHWSLGKAPFSGAVPAGRSGHTFTAFPDGGMCVLFGGLVTDADQKTHATNDVYLLDTATMKWSQPQLKGKIPPPLHGHTATLVGSDLVVVGGQNGMDVSSAVFVLDLTSGTWSCPVAKGLNLAFHAAAYVPSRNAILALVQASVLSLSLADWKWTELDTDMKGLGRAPRSFVSHTATLVGDSRLFVFGGKVLGLNMAAGASGRTYQMCSSDLRILDTNTLVWSAPDVTGPDVRQPPVDYANGVFPTWKCPRAEHTATLVGSDLYVVGGWTSANPSLSVVDQSYCVDVQILNTATLAWSTPKLHHLVPARGLHAAALVGADIWVFGGHTTYAESLADFAVLHTGAQRNETELKAATATPKKKPVAAAAAAAGAAAGAGAAAPAAGAPKPATTKAPAAPVAAPKPAVAPAKPAAPAQAAGDDDILGQFSAQEGL